MGPVELRMVGRETLRRWTILITRLGSLPLGSGEGLINLHGGAAGNCRTRQN